MSSADYQEVQLYTRTEWGAEGFKKVPPESPPLFIRPTILCCGGTLCNHSPDGVAKANGFTKKAEAMLNIIDLPSHHKPFQIASVTYADACLIGENIKAYNSGMMPPNMFEAFVDKQLVPLFMKSDHTKRPVVEAKQLFRNIQVMAHSYGGIFIQQVGNVLVDKMTKAGFSPEEIDDITRQVVVVTSGSVADMHKGKAKFTTLHILHGRDKVATEYSSNIGVARALKGLRDQDEDPLAAIPFTYDAQTRGFNISQDPHQILLVTNPSEFDDPTAIRFKDSKNGYSRIPHGESSHVETTDNHFHESETYYDFSFINNGMMLRLAATNILNAALNNSLENYRNATFIPMAPLEDMLVAPQVKIAEDNPAQANSERNTTSKFDFDATNDFSFVARAIGYNQRMQDALHAVHASPRAIE